MKRVYNILLGLVAVFLMSAHVVTAQSEPTYKLELRETSKLWLEGDSSLHAFECFAEVLNLDSTLSPGAVTSVSNVTVVGANSNTAKITDLTLTIPIEEMTSPKAGLASRMHKTLKYKEYPNIVFQLAGYDVIPTDTGDGSYSITVDGTVALAGVTNAMQIAMEGQRADGHATVKGEKDLLMSDFGITPPTMFFGRIKVADKIVIKWELEMGITSEEGGDETEE